MRESFLFPPIKIVFCNPNYYDRMRATQLKKTSTNQETSAKEKASSKEEEVDERCEYPRHPPSISAETESLLSAHLLQLGGSFQWS